MNRCLGITIVVSPLISLVEDQIYALQNLKIDARSLNATTPRAEQNEIMRILDGTRKDESTMKVLYLTPGKSKQLRCGRLMPNDRLEKIAKSRTIMAKLQKLYESNRFARLIVDEVHCVSQYGHDFRPGKIDDGIFRR